jgi:8-oxo-dGTP pyrophosphatase MutT (NUDIX family)
MPAALKSMIVGLVSGIEPTDDLGREHRRNAFSWLAGTDDIFRREKPLTPSPHLVSYFLLVDRPAGSVLLCDHQLSGLWLPTGGHVEPGEHPLGTVRREAVEELGVTAQLDAAFRDRPFFLTMTETVGPPRRGTWTSASGSPSSVASGSPCIRTSANSPRSGGGRPRNFATPAAMGSNPTCCVLWTRSGSGSGSVADRQEDRMVTRFPPARDHAGESEPSYRVSGWGAGVRLATAATAVHRNSRPRKMRS